MLKLSWYLGLGLLWSCNAAEFGGRIIDGRHTYTDDASTVIIYSIPAADESKAFITSGVAISPRLVLGTAQAVETVIDNERIVFEQHKLGFNNIVVADQIIATADRVAAHPNYHVDRLEYNIAAFHLADDLIESYILFANVGDIPFPNAVKIFGYGAPNEDNEFSSALLQSIATPSTECPQFLNSLVYGPTNRCIETDHELAQGDQGGPITNSWLTPESKSLFGLVSYWIRSNPRLVVITNVKHVDIERFINTEFLSSQSL